MTGQMEHVHGTDGTDTSLPCDPSMYRTRTGKCPTERFLSACGYLAQSAPLQSVFRALLGTFRGKVLFNRKALRGTPSQVLKSTQEALRGALSARAPGHSCKWRPGSQVAPKMFCVYWFVLSPLKGGLTERGPVHCLSALSVRQQYRTDTQMGHPIPC